MSTAEDKTMPTVNVRYMLDDVEAAVAFYTTHLGFALISKVLPAFADVALGDLLCCSADRRVRLDGRCPTAVGPRPAAGTVSTSSLMTFPSRSLDSASRRDHHDRRAREPWPVPQRSRPRTLHVPGAPRRRPGGRGRHHGQPRLRERAR